MQSRKRTYKILGFIILLLLANTALDWFYKNKVMAEMINSRKDREFYRLQEDFKYLLLGDSHFQNGVNPMILGNAYNFSSANENIIQSYYKLKYIIEKSDKELDYILLPLDLSTFNSIRSDRFKYHAYWIKYINYYELARHKKDKSLFFTGLFARYMSYAGNYETFYRYFFSEGKGRSQLILGYRPKHGDFKSKKARKDITQLHEELYQSKHWLDDDLISYFKRIMDLCENNSLKLVLVKMPVSKQHHEKISKVVDMENYHQKINQILADKKDVYVLDYQTLFFEHDNYFNNPDHLNARGADKFSAQLKTDLEKLEHGNP
jgi:hypothetical protein